MSGDKLAARRAQQQRDGAPNSSAGPGLNGNERPYEMSEVASGNMTALNAEISTIKDKTRLYNENVVRIAELHDQSLRITDEASEQRVNRQLSEQIEQTRVLSAELQRRIQALEALPMSGANAESRKSLVALVKSKFLEAIQNYQKMEQTYRTRYRERLERQFKIVKPEATDAEVAAVVNDEGGNQIFTQALMGSNRYGESRAAYREVQERHEEIKQIERTLAELAQLFNEMSMFVARDDEKLDAIAQNTSNVVNDTEAGTGYIGRAVEYARHARKMRWICFFLTLVILAAIAGGIYAGVHNK